MYTHSLYKGYIRFHTYGYIAILIRIHYIYIHNTMNIYIVFFKEKCSYSLASALVGRKQNNIVG